MCGFRASASVMTETTNESGFTLRIRLARGDELVMGPGRADMLELIQATGSIAAAGRQMGMSYKRAWALVESMNGLFRAPVVAAVKGGAGGGGARLTETGLQVLHAYRGLEAASLQAGAAFLAELDAALAVSHRRKDA
jgi:molybdate transport system regulatory protein